MMIIIIVIQIKVSDLKAREGHCAGALVLSSKLMEVIIFGGYDGLNYIAATTVLRFGEYTILLSFTYQRHSQEFLHTEAQDRVGI